MHHGTIYPESTRKVNWWHEHVYEPNQNNVGVRAVQKCCRKRFGIIWGRWRTNRSVHLWGEFTDSDPALDPQCPRFAYVADRAARYRRLPLFTHTWTGQPLGYCMPDCAPEAKFYVGNTQGAHVWLCE